MDRGQEWKGLSDHSLAWKGQGVGRKSAELPVTGGIHQQLCTGDLWVT